MGFEIAPSLKRAANDSVSSDQLWLHDNGTASDTILTDDFVQADNFLAGLDSASNNPVQGPTL